MGSNYAPSHPEAASVPPDGDWVNCGMRWGGTLNCGGLRPKKAPSASIFFYLSLML